MITTLIAAMDSNNGIGKANTLPWRLKSDLAHFKAYTLGKTLVMGSTTLRGLPGVLKGRDTILLSRSDVTARRYGNRVIHAKSIADVLMYSDGIDELVIAGGANVYEQFIPTADKLVITHINASCNCDTFFPKIDPAKWEMVDNQFFKADENNQYDYNIATYTRVK